MGHLRSLFVLGLFAVCLGACSSRTGEVESAMSSDGAFAIVNAVDLSETVEGAKLVISANKELKYNVFKLTDPERIMVDLIDAQLDPSSPENITGSGDLIDGIKVQAIQDSISTLVRLEVRLASAANYLAALEGSSLVIRVFPAGAEMPQDENAISDDSVADVMLPLPAPEEGVSDEIPPLGELPSLDDEALSEAGEMTAIQEAPSVPEPELSAPELAPAPEITPPPAPLMAEPTIPEAPEVVEPAPEMLSSQEVPEASTGPAEPAIEPAPPVAPLPLPVPLVEENKEEKVAEAPAEENRVIVEPEGPPLPSIDTQDVTSSEPTEGMSLLSGMGTKVYTGRRVSLEFQNAEIQDVVRLIAEVSKLNIILSDDVKGKITLKLIDVPWDQALDIILTSKGLDKVQHGNILRVAPIENLKKEREIALANDKAAKQLEPLRLKLFNVNYAVAGEMSARIKNLLSERGSVDTDERTNTLIVEDISENLSRVENLINVLDTQTPQVRIESRIVQANDTFTRSLGIQWGPTLRLDDINQKQTDFQFPRTINVGTAPLSGIGFTAPAPSQLTEFAVDALPGGTGASSIGFRLGSINDIFNLDLRLSYAENEQLARIVSRPSVTVLDNRTARIIQGTKIPFLSSSSDGSNVQFQEAGIEISVTPQITNDGSVILKVATKSNEPASENVGGNPIISIREANTEMLIKSGRTAVLGGVFKTTEREGRSGVPGLMNIPVLGWLFKGQQKSNAREEMLIFITPHILTDTRDAVSAPNSTSKLAP